MTVCVVNNEDKMLTVNRLLTEMQTRGESDYIPERAKKEDRTQLPAPAAVEPTPFAASVSPSVKQQASSAHRGQPGAALADLSTGLSLWRAGAPFLPDPLGYL